MNVKVVIPSALASNLMPCLYSILAMNPLMSGIVVDDGAKPANDAGFIPPDWSWVDGLKPFVFARNVNLGITAAGDADVILLNDDAILTTAFGFSRWAEAMQERRDTVCSAAIVGTVCNPRQFAQSTNTFRPEPQHLAFVCVYIPRPVIDRVGLLDERFTAYGYEDFDFCRRAREAGCRLATWDGCVVDHSGHSTFRSSTEWPSLLMQGRQIYLDKWEAG
jgi:GT2 family glycosyltransferase